MTETTVPKQKIIYTTHSLVIFGLLITEKMYIYKQIIAIIWIIIGAIIFFLCETFKIKCKKLSIVI